jgi:C-terminal processing protease CtpA/Prc
MGVVPGGVAERAGIKVGDQLLRIGEVTVDSPDFGPAYRQRYGTAAEGTPVAIVVRRAGQEVTLQGSVHFVDVVTTRIVPDPNAGPKAVRIRNGIVRGQ